MVDESLLDKIRRGVSERLSVAAYRAHAALNPRYRLPPAPWSVAQGAGEVIAEFPGAFAPPPEARYYGTARPASLRQRKDRSGPLQLRRHRNVVAFPQRLTFTTDGAMLPQSMDLLYVPRRQKSWDGPKGYPALRAILPGRKLDGPVLLAGSSFPGYGHMLMEVGPQMAVALPHLPVETRVAVWEPSAPGTLEMLGAAPDRVIAHKGPLWCDEAYIIDAPVDLSGNYHPAAREAFTRLADGLVPDGGGKGARLYLSRRRVSVRRLENESEVEELFRAKGFDVIHMQELPAVEQARLIRSASMVAGPAGSAMHSLVFAAPGVKALYIASTVHHVTIDLQFAQSNGQVGYVFGGPASPDDARHSKWTVDINQVRGAIEAHFGL